MEDKERLRKEAAGNHFKGEVAGPTRLTPQRQIKKVWLTRGLCITVQHALPALPTKRGLPDFCTFPFIAKNVLHNIKYVSAS